MLFTIITPTTGNPKLARLLTSINEQIVSPDVKIEHFIVVDGPAFQTKTETILKSVAPGSNVAREVFQLPFNTGANNYFGHKIYASISQLARGDYVILQDEDNWLDVNHIASCYSTLKADDGLHWCFSLRKIVSNEGQFICNDDCESLGFLHPAFYHPDIYMIDTNCTCVSREIVLQISNIWNRKGFNTNDDPDRLYSRLLMENFKKYDCTYTYSIHYRVANRNDSVKGELFLKGNEVIKSKFSGTIPWTKPNRLVVAHFNKENTDKILSRVYCPSPKESIGYKQWQLNILDCMDDRFLMSAYGKYIPSGSKMLVHMCNPGELPVAQLERSDIEKVLYTIEGPNIRHQQQWSLEFLLKYFTKIITYWKPLLSISSHLDHRISYFPFIHRFDMTNPQDTAAIIENTNTGKQVCIVLEKRDIQGDYSINGVSMKAHDHLRWAYASKLGKRIDCYGRTWEPHRNVIEYREAKNRFLDEERVIDIMAKYTFALIIENCNGDGYVSEKIYDALCVGCIPLYYGNNNSQLNIPSDCYIDLREISPDDLPRLLDRMDAEFIDMFRKNIYKKRIDILTKVSVNEYNKLLHELS